MLQCPLHNVELRPITIKTTICVEQQQLKFEQGVKIFSAFASIQCRTSKNAVCISKANNFEHFV
jgi:hypothetical protein